LVSVPWEPHPLVQGPYGAKGAGEGGILAIAPAIGAAVNEAAGVTIRDLPLTPERVWRAVEEARSVLKL
jgi:CO/xanthine dehydrogenase Mo-binding subunit